MYMWHDNYDMSTVNMITLSTWYMEMQSEDFTTVDKM